jgi:hypothetical protein
MATLNYDYSFTPNTPARASEVNSNFNKVKEFVESISNGTNIDAGAISGVKILDGAVGELKIANNAVTTAKILDGNVTNTKLDYNTVPRTTVSTGGPSGGKDGDIWIQVP